MITIPPIYYKKIYQVHVEYYLQAASAQWIDNGSQLLIFSWLKSDPVKRGHVNFCSYHNIITIYTIVMENVIVVSLLLGFLVWPVDKNKIYKI